MMVIRDLNHLSANIFCSVGQRSGIVLLMSVDWISNLRC